MPRNTSPKSKWYDQYAKEYRRITQAIRRQEKLGYFIPEEVKPTKPSEMSTIRKSDVQRLINLTPKKIRKQSVYVDTDTGEAFPGLDIVKSHHKAKPSKAKSKSTTSKKKRKPKKPTPPQPEHKELDTFWYGDDIDYVPEPQRQYYPGFENIAITGYLQQLKQFPNAEGARMLSDWLTKLINEFGRHAVAVMLDEGSREGNIVTWETVYKGGVQVYMTNMMEYLPGLGADDKQRLGEIMEEMESWESPI